VLKKRRNFSIFSKKDQNFLNFLVFQSIYFLQSEKKVVYLQRE